MKKLFKFACALLAGLAVFACDDQHQEEIKFCTEISTNVTELAQFAAENAEAQTIEVTADGQWMSIAPAWVEVKPNVGYAGTTTVTVKATLIVSASASEDDVYKITKAIFDNIDAIKATHAKGAELSLENATSGMTAPFHKGAAKYFAEKGIDVESK